MLILFIFSTFIMCTSSLQVNSATSLDVYVTAMINAGDVCNTVIGSNSYTLTAKNCATSCGYPDGVCVTEYNQYDIFAVPIYKCVGVPKACISAVEAEDGDTPSTTTTGTTTSTTLVATPTSTTNVTTATTAITTTLRTTTTAVTTTVSSTTTITATTTVTHSSPQSSTGASLPAECTDPRDSGTRSSDARFSIMYYYDTSTKTCVSFLYMGAGGNANRHATRPECQKACIWNTVTLAPANAHSKIDCLFPPRVGLVTRNNPQRCEGSGVSYSALSISNSIFCVSFEYSNCPSAGNANNFRTREECQAVCNSDL